MVDTAQAKRCGGGAGIRVGPGLAAFRTMSVVLALAGASATLTEAAAQSYRPRDNRLAASTRALQSYPVCNRAAVRDCYTDAQLSVRACQIFPSTRLACAGEVLTALEMCWAATGCW